MSGGTCVGGTNGSGTYDSGTKVAPPFFGMLHLATIYFLIFSMQLVSLLLTSIKYMAGFEPTTYWSS
jgi:hypothetical protein